MQESLGVVKLFYNLTEPHNGHLRFNFFPRKEEDLAEIYDEQNMEQLQPTPQPYAKSLYLLEQTLVTILSYLSQGNFHNTSNDWLESEDVDKTDIRDAVIDVTRDEGGSPVSAMKELSRIMMLGIKYIKRKIEIGRRMIDLYNVMRLERESCNNLNNKVIRGTITKTAALEKIDKLIQSVEELAVVMVELLKMEPNDNEFLAMRILFENTPFSDNLQDLEVIRRMEEASDESPNLACWVNPNATGKEDLPLLMTLYAEGMANYAEIKNARIEEEEVDKTVARLVANINKDIRELVPEVFSSTKETSPSVIQDLVRQLEDIRRRLVSAINMTDKPVIFEEVTFRSGNTDMTVSAEAFLRLAVMRFLL